MRACLALALAALASACASTPAVKVPLIGTYGGQHIRMVVGTSDSDIEYDCAEGMLAGPLPVRGSFLNAGTHTPGTGGPEREGQLRPAYPATYRGHVLADSVEMVVDVDLPSGRTRLGPFHLQRGSNGILMRCL
jgi:hypothetical protein